MFLLRLWAINNKQGASTSYIPAVVHEKTFIGFFDNNKFILKTSQLNCLNFKGGKQNYFLQFDQIKSEQQKLQTIFNF